MIFPQFLTNNVIFHFPRRTWVTWTWRLWLLTSQWTAKTFNWIPSSRSQSPWREFQQDLWVSTAASPKNTRASATSPTSSSPCPPLLSPKATTSTGHRPGLQRRREAPTRGTWTTVQAHVWWGTCRILLTRLQPAPLCPLWAAGRICSGHRTLF